MAALVLARRSASAVVNGANLGARGLWHAPLPTRYRFAVQSANKVMPPSSSSLGGSHDLHSGGRWAPWAGAPYSSLGQGQIFGGGDGGRALKEIRSFMEQQEATNALHVKILQSVSSQQSNLSEMVEEIKANSSKKDGWAWGSLLNFFLMSASGWWFFTQGAEKATNMVREFLTIHLSILIKDPKVQESIQVSAETFMDSGMRRINPWSWFMEWLYGKDKEINPSTMSTDQLVAMTTCFSLLILLQVQLQGSEEGSEEDKLIQRLDNVGLKDVEVVTKTLELLVNLGYLEKFTVKGSEGDLVYYKKSDSAFREYSEGIMHQKIQNVMGKGWLRSLFSNS